MVPRHANPAAASASLLFYVLATWGSSASLSEAQHRILVVNPNTSQAMTDQIAANARRHARPDTEIVAVRPERGPEIILGHYENQVATAEMLHLVEGIDPASYDAVIVAAYSDAGLYALRELLEVPVVGIAEASMLLGHTLGYRFTILSFVERLRPMFEDLVKLHGFEDRLASIRMVELPASGLRDAAGRPHPALVEAAKAALREDGAEVILLGGATLTGLDEALTRELQAPVIDGVVAAVKIAESLLDYGRRTSKQKAFRRPESKARK